MTVQTPLDLQGLLTIGRIIAETLRLMQDQVVPGITTRELDALAGAYLRRHGARSAPALSYNFPGHSCISINDEAAHGIPGDRVIKAGDIVKLDVSAERAGYIADAAVTMAVPPVSPLHERLCQAAAAALSAAIGAARAGAPLNQLGRAAEQVARRSGFSIVRELCSHGVGRGLHEEPKNIPQFYVPQARQPLPEGLVITLEPHLSVRSSSLRESSNGWTLLTRNRSPVAVYEHTIMITAAEALVVTAL